MFIENQCDVKSSNTLFQYTVISMFIHADFFFLNTMYILYTFLYTLLCISIHILYIRLL